MNPRYVAYCLAHSRTPDEMLAVDRRAWPGGCMCGFMLWVQARWREWDIKCGNPRNHARTMEEHAEFDSWLISVDGR